MKKRIIFNFNFTMIWGKPTTKTRLRKTVIHVLEAQVKSLNNLSRKYNVWTTLNTETQRISDVPEQDLENRKNKLETEQFLPDFFLGTGGLEYLRGRKTPVPAHSFFTPEPPSKAPPTAAGRPECCWFWLWTCRGGHADCGKFRARPHLPFS